MRGNTSIGDTLQDEHTKVSRDEVAIEGND